MEGRQNPPFQQRHNTIHTRTTATNDRTSASADLPPSGITLDPNRRLPSFDSLMAASLRLGNETSFNPPFVESHGHDSSLSHSAYRALHLPEPLRMGNNQHSVASGGHTAIQPASHERMNSNGRSAAAEGAISLSSTAAGTLTEWLCSQFGERRTAELLPLNRAQPVLSSTADLLFVAKNCPMDLCKHGMQLPEIQHLNKISLDVQSPQPLQHLSQPLNVSSDGHMGFHASSTAKRLYEEACENFGSKKPKAEKGRMSGRGQNTIKLSFRWSNYNSSEGRYIRVYAPNGGGDREYETSNVSVTCGSALETAISLYFPDGFNSGTGLTAGNLEFYLCDEARREITNEEHQLAVVSVLNNRGMPGKRKVLTLMSKKRPNPDEPSPPLQLQLPSTTNQTVITDFVLCSSENTAADSPAARTRSRNAITPNDPNGSTVFFDTPQAANEVNAAIPQLQAIFSEIRASDIENAVTASTNSSGSVDLDLAAQLLMPLEVGVAASPNLAPTASASGSMAPAPVPDSHWHRSAFPLPVALQDVDLRNPVHARIVVQRQLRQLDEVASISPMRNDFQASLLELSKNQTKLTQIMTAGNLRVRFLTERGPEAAVGVGVTKEYLTWLKDLLVRGFAFDKSGQLAGGGTSVSGDLTYASIFYGDDGKKLFNVNKFLDHSSSFRAAGCACAILAVHSNGPILSGLSPLVYNAILASDPEQIHCTADDVIDPCLKDLLEELTKTENISDSLKDNLKPYLDAIDVISVTKDNRSVVIDLLCQYSVVERSWTSIVQFRKGLKDSGLFGFIKAHPALWQSLFPAVAPPASAEQVISVLRFRMIESDEDDSFMNGRNRLRRAPADVRALCLHHQTLWPSRLKEFLRSLDQKGIDQFLVLTSAGTECPSSITVSFTYSEEEIQAQTCFQNINISLISDPELIISRLSAWMAEKSAFNQV